MCDTPPQVSLCICVAPHSPPPHLLYLWDAHVYMGLFGVSRLCLLCFPLIGWGGGGRGKGNPLSICREFRVPYNCRQEATQSHCSWGEGGEPLSQQALNLKPNLIHLACPIPSPGKPAQTSCSLLFYSLHSVFLSCLLKINVWRLQKHDIINKPEFVAKVSNMSQFVAKVSNTSQANFLLLFIDRAKYHGCSTRS